MELQNRLQLQYQLRLKEVLDGKFGAPSNLVYGRSSGNGVDPWEREHLCAALDYIKTGDALSVPDDVFQSKPDPGKTRRLFETFCFIENAINTCLPKNERLAKFWEVREAVQFANHREGIWYRTRPGAGYRTFSQVVAWETEIMGFARPAELKTLVIRAMMADGRHPIALGQELFMRDDGRLCIREIAPCPEFQDGGVTNAGIKWLANRMLSLELGMLSGLTGKDESSSSATSETTADSTSAINSSDKPKQDATKRRRGGRPKGDSFIELAGDYIVSLLKEADGQMPLQSIWNHLKHAGGKEGSPFLAGKKNPTLKKSNGTEFTISRETLANNLTELRKRAAQEI